jgi:hypothetical protein
MSGMKPACKGTAKDRNFTFAGRFRLIQILDAWIIETPYPRKCKNFSLKTGSVCCFRYNKILKESLHRAHGVDEDRYPTSSTITTHPVRRRDQGDTRKRWKWRLNRSINLFSPGRNKTLSSVSHCCTTTSYSSR